MAKMSVSEFRRFLRGVLHTPKGELFRLDREIEKLGLDTFEVESTGLPRKNEEYYGIRVLALTYRWDHSRGLYRAYVMGHRLATGEATVLPWKHLVKGRT